MVRSAFPRVSNHEATEEPASDSSEQETLYASFFKARSSSSSRSWPQKISPEGST